MTDKKQFSDGDVHELVSLYALGALDEDDKVRFEEHLDECTACEAELRSLTEVAASLGNSRTAAPPPQLRERLMTRARSSRQAPGIIFEQGGILLSRSSEIPWQRLGPGIEFKLLYADAARKYRTSLVRMEAGSQMPKHRHQETEELFILSGELHVEGQVARAGDYCRADAHSVHAEAFTPSGATFLVMASENDEFLL
jgi:anti-sigma factor ChrR (cupin superfamily)